MEAGTAGTTQAVLGRIPASSLRVPAVSPATARSDRACQDDPPAVALRYVSRWVALSDPFSSVYRQSRRGRSHSSALQLGIYRGPQPPGCLSCLQPLEGNSVKPVQSTISAMIVEALPLCELLCSMASTGSSVPSMLRVIQLLQPPTPNAEVHQRHCQGNLTRTQAQR